PVWAAAASAQVRGRLAFPPAEAARRQGRFDELHPALLLARHRDRLDLDDPEVVDRTAAGSGLDLDRFHTDLADPSILQSLAHDHRLAVAQQGVFATPTRVFAGGR